ncbi:2OG-Fe(II) oxygenase family protein [Pectobacteriaceae bacterium CE90]|nr:2OG-Fe(II) oxygenase family protein [Pectobacteriaceae bacterium CE90]
MDNLKNRFSQKGYLSKNLADMYDSELKLIMESAESTSEDSWTYIFRNSSEQRDLVYGSPDSEVSTCYDLCYQDYCLNKFSFFFRRLLNESSEEIVNTEASKIAYNFCNSDDLKNLLQYYTGRKIGEIEVFYINRFDKGHFLNTHTDSGNNIGIALNITKNWDPNYGGLTHILDHNRKKVIDTLTPTFGELFLFDTSQTQIPHLVSMINVNQKNKRMSVIARYGKA